MRKADYEEFDDLDEDLEMIADCESRIQEFHDIVLSHDPEKVQEFFESRGRGVPSKKIALLTSYAYVCNESFFTEEERAAAEKWLRDNRYEYLIHKRNYN